jgi:membrane fusion protein, multidrug efflux system
MRRLVVLLPALAALLAAGCFASYWYTAGRYIEKTDNAYIRSEITQISSKVAGYVREVPVLDNAPVEVGDLLVRVESGEFLVRLENGRKKMAERRAALAVAKQRSRLQISRIAACQAQLAAVEAELSRKVSELRRFATLVPSGIISELDYESIQTAEKKSRAEVASASANLESARAEREVFLAEEGRLEAELRQQAEELKLPAQELSDTCIRAPIAGEVGNRRVRAGQYVKPGTLLMALIPRQALWVEANFKEGQLTRMHQGQPVSLEVDAFPGQPLSGRLESLSPASGAEFSLIPPENAAGNFTKVVQRVPVKIRFDPGQGLLRELRAGMSVLVRADTRAAPGASSASAISATSSVRAARVAGALARPGAVPARP